MLFKKLGLNKFLQPQLSNIENALSVFVTEVHDLY